MRTASIPLVATRLMTAGAHADPLTLDPPRVPERMRLAYERSDGARRVVDDLDLPDDDLARLEAGPNRWLFVGVIAASGAQHAAGSQVRWSKGSAASLLDVTRGDSPVAECRQSMGGSRG